jgi:hypothetical protein
MLDLISLSLASCVSLTSSSYIADSNALVDSWFLEAFRGIIPGSVKEVRPRNKRLRAMVEMFIISISQT